MPKNRLEFEKSIQELEEKLVQLKEFGNQQDIDVSHGIRQLEETIAKAKNDLYKHLNPWHRVQLARHPERPYPQDYVEAIFTDFIELKGDRRYSDDKAIFGGFAKFNDQPVVVIGTRKGRNLEENVEVNFGSAHPEGYRKALRIMQLAEKARLPIICLIDTPGAYPGIGAEERHIGEAIAVNLEEMFRFTVPIVAVVVGEGGSGGALGVAVGNQVLIMENAYYSVITPEGCSAILWRDGSQAPKAAEALKITADDLMQLGIVDGVVPEPLGGADKNWEQAAAFLVESLEKSLKELTALSTDELCKQRYERFRRLGVYTEGSQ